MNEVLLRLSDSVLIFPFVCHAHSLVRRDFDEINFEFLLFTPCLFVQLLHLEPLLVVSIRQFLKLTFNLLLERLDHDLAVFAVIGQIGQQFAYILNVIEVQRLQERDQVIVKFKH